ncbi:hypothetical protein [Microbacterium sp.]|uniref:hypothetical protein n=1 Tax=Microbacterium sp. TaxID=51671 RepID=UPI0039E23D83
MRMPRSRICRAAVGAALAAVLLSGCTPTPEPTPTPTGFATDEEAFEAAEATYRAYVDALNEVDLADPATFEPVFALTTGEANKATRKSFSEMHAKHWKVSGTNTVALVEPLDSESLPLEAQLAVCVDVSTIQLTDADGNSVVGQRPRQQSLLVTVAEVPDAPYGWLISSFAGRQGEPTCAT